MLPRRNALEIATPRLSEVSITGGFWGHWSRVHTVDALDHQWRELELAGSIENFRIVAHRSDGFRCGHLTSDSDVYKWVDAASRALTGDVPQVTVGRLEEIIGLIETAQTADGYLSTWIQALFPSDRFQNLELEHELYCLGHLIEAGVSHHEATGSPRLLAVARRAADLLVREFLDASPARLDGHEEIEIALIRLYRATGTPQYLELARRLVERRGTEPRFVLRLLVALLRTAGHYGRRSAQLARFTRRNPAWDHPAVPRQRTLRATWQVVPQFLADIASGRTFQMDGPIRGAVSPRGHSVRFMYLQTAAAMLARELGDDSLRVASELTWEQFVTGHLFASGGAGALALVEGFGRPYDLDPATAYAETCAAIGGVLWNRELGLLTGDARYDDLLEWQLLNAADVGMGIDGSTYFYDNPLTTTAGVKRHPWYQIPCCPSNLSRLWTSLGTNQYSWADGELTVHQFISSRAELPFGVVTMDSTIPWTGDVELHLPVGGSAPHRIKVRAPSWADQPQAWLDDTAVHIEARPPSAAGTTASGVDPRGARWFCIDIAPGSEGHVRLRFDMPVRLHRQDVRVPRVGGWVALSRGPLLYCLEGRDHGVDISDVAVDRDSIRVEFEPELLGGTTVLRAQSTEGIDLQFIPYFLWGNRGATGMTVFVR